MLRAKLILDSKERIRFRHMSSTEIHKLCERKVYKDISSTQFHKGL